MRHLFKDGLHSLDSGRWILAKNFIFNLNNFLYQIQHYNLRSNSDELSVYQKEEFSSSKPSCNRNDAVSEYVQRW